MSSDWVATLASGQKVKRRLLRMRACDEPNAKGKICTGHLKRWAKPDASITAEYGPEIYRCERCHTLYLPNPQEAANTRILRF